MNENIVNSLLFETLNKIRSIETSIVSMWAINDKYASPPYLRFRFKNTVMDDAIYSTLCEVITGFNGSLQWEMIHNITKSASFFFT